LSRIDNEPLRVPVARGEKDNAIAQDAWAASFDPAWQVEEPRMA
jgi:hypothetical protein